MKEPWNKHSPTRCAAGGFVWQMQTPACVIAPLLSPLGCGQANQFRATLCISKVFAVVLQGVPVSLPRCAASMLRCRGSPPWHCQLCRRVHSSAQPCMRPPACLFCGITLGPQLPQCLQQLPALPLA